MIRYCAVENRLNKKDKIDERESKFLNSLEREEHWWKLFTRESRSSLWRCRPESH